MCLSTTGFGSSTDKPGAEQPSQGPFQDPLPQPQGKPLDHREATVTRVDRSLSAHSMRDIIPGPDSRAWEQGEFNGPQYSVNYTQPQGHPQQYASQRQFSTPNNHLLAASPSPQNYPGYFSSQHQSPPQQYYSMDPFKPEQQQQQQHPEPISQSLPPHPDQSLADLTDLDFLNFSRSYPPLHHRPPYENITTSGPSVSHNAEAPLMSPMQQPFDASRPSGLDLRFGMGVDFQHDWSDGGGFDLFDGFFFGAGGGVNGYGV